MQIIDSFDYVNVLSIETTTMFHTFSVTRTVFDCFMLMLQMSQKGKSFVKQTQSCALDRMEFFFYISQIEETIFF